MYKDNPASRMLLKSGTLFVVLPLYAAVLLSPSIGVLWILSRFMARGAGSVAPILYLLLLGYLASLVWILWRGRLLGAIIIFCATFFVHGFLGNPDATKLYELQIGATLPVRGVDVYCNGVHLGKTPLTISKEEFREKVKPWDKPPRQERLSIRDAEERDNHRYTSGRFFYVPDDVFEAFEKWPNIDFGRYYKNNDLELLQEIGSSQYWWHFEKTGCGGLTRIGSFADGSSGSGGLMTIKAEPAIEFPSAGEHLALLLEDLRGHNYEPRPEWVKHFLKYKGLLFLEFHRRVQSDERFRPALEALVRAEFNVSEDPTERDCARVVDEILNRVESWGSFTLPSLESEAILLVGRAHPELIAKRFVSSLRVGLGWAGGTRSSNNWQIQHRSGKGVRRLPLEYAVRKIRPDQLYNRLVYMSRSGRYLDIVGNYPRKESVYVIQNYLSQVERGEGQGRFDYRHQIDGAIDLCSKVHHPDPNLEERLRSFVREHGPQGEEHQVERFVESRLKSTGQEARDFLGWIFHWAPLSEDKKLQYVCRIENKWTYHYLRLLGGGDQRREQAISQLAGTPNPSLDEFLIDSYEWYQRHGREEDPANLYDAIIKTDTPAIREFLTELWNKAGEERNNLLRPLRRRKWHEPHTNWLTPMIAELADNQERLMAVELLPKIDTDDAWQLAEEWAQDPDEKVATAAKKQLEQRDQRLRERQQRLEKAADLIAGRIKPDDLLPPTQPYLWNGAGYVLETDKSEKN